MTPGKAASQAGHAFLEAYLQANILLQGRYRYDGIGTKVVLVAATEADLQRAVELARGVRLPAQLIIDSGHVQLPHFTGAPIITAAGIGPATREQVGWITEGFALF